ncbi:hypothetical protein EDD11_003574 [Mortierella claussenii]|nr:hypothetical protein EDD11_003574 [Mortierella claussenii]
MTITTLETDHDERAASAGHVDFKTSVGTPLAVIDGVSFSGDPWTNWGRNLTCQPEATFYPNGLQDLKVIVREAKANNKKIRCAGTGHSWCASSVTDGYLVSVNNMNKVHTPKQNSEGMWTVTLESGATVEELDQFLRMQNPPLCLPSCVVPNTHGASIHARTMCDMLTELTIVNAHGELVTYSEASDPEAFNAASLNLGLFGIIYTVTLRVETMSTRLLLRDSNPTVASLFEGSDAALNLKTMILKNDSTEFIYWPFKKSMKPDQNDRIWIKEWERTTLPAEKENPNLNRAPMVDNPFFSTFYVGERVMETPDALHFHMGDGVTTIVDVGAAFKVDNGFNNGVQAFHELIEKNWAFTTSMPERMGTALEMRFIKSSSKMMSPVYDEDPEAIYCMINVMAVTGTPGFEEYSIGIMNHWIEKYNAKPHWPKMWEKVPGVFSHLRRSYGDRLVRFDRVRRAQDPQNMFVNDIWKQLLPDS